MNTYSLHAVIHFNAKTHKEYLFKVRWFERALKQINDSAPNQKLMTLQWIDSKKEPWITQYGSLIKQPKKK